MRFGKEHIKSVIIIILLAVVGVLVYHDISKPQKPSPGPLPIEVKTDDQEKPNAIGAIIPGTVLQYGTNHKGDIDKILLQTAKGQLWVHFPPHAAGRLLALAPINAMVRAGISNERPGDEPVKELISLESDKTKNKIMVPDILPPMPSTGMPTEFSGTSTTLQVDEHQHVVGFILAGKLVELKHGLAETMGPLLKAGKLIKVKGIARSADGFVNSRGYVLVKPISINIDNVNYVVP